MKSTTLKMLLSGSVISALALTSGCTRKEDKTESTGKVVETQDDRDLTGDLNERAPVERDLEGDMNAAGDEIERTAVHARDEVVTSTRQTLDTLSRKIDELEAGAADQGEELNKDTRDMVQSLKEQRAELAARLDRADEVSEDNWEAFEGETKRAMDKLEEGYNDVLESMKTND